MPKRKLTRDHVSFIKEMINDGIDQQTIANSFDVSLPLVKAISAGQRWPGVEPAIIPRKEREKKNGSNKQHNR